MAEQSAPTHDELVATYTGGMVPAAQPAFEGSRRLRPDGRPLPEIRSELRRIPDLANALTVSLSIALPILVVAGVIVVDSWPILFLAVPLMAIAQNRLFILHHEAAHRLLFSRRRINDLVGITGIGFANFGTGTHHYRRGHVNHHRDEFGPKEPDFILYSFYPITRSSMRRKLRRDAVGISAWRIVKPRFTGLAKREFVRLSLRFFAGQLMVFALFFLAGVPLLYLVLWVLPYATVYQLMNRLRAIAEHGGMTRSPDRRDTTHHVRQSRWSALLVPMGVGYHIAHHVDSGIPFRNLAKLHDMLLDDGYITEDIVWPSYRTLWQALASRSTAAA